MPGFLNIKVTTRKNGQEVAWFKDILGRRVGTSTGLIGNRSAITNAEQMAWLANYWIELLQEQLDRGIGSDGAPMPPLAARRRKRWSVKRQEWVEYGEASPENGWGAVKRRAGLKPIRDLWGLGGATVYHKPISKKSQSLLGRLGLVSPPPKKVTLAPGHMRNDIRINYVDDSKAKISITTQASRIKALANERRAPWWGLSPENSRKFASAMASMYGGAMEDYLDSLGLVNTGNYMVVLASKLNRMKGDPMWQARVSRRVA